MKSIFSFVIIGIFLFAALASFGPDEATNTTVPISDCETMPFVAGLLQVEILVRDKSLTPIPDRIVHIFATHQKVNPDNTCTFQSTETKITLETDVDGKIKWFGPGFGHDNKEDLWRVQVKVQGDDNWDPAGDVQVLKYNQAIFGFFIIQLNKDDI